MHALYKTKNLQSYNGQLRGSKNTGLTYEANASLESINATQPPATPFPPIITTPHPAWQPLRHQPQAGTPQGGTT